MEMQIEMGYRNASYLREDLDSSLLVDERKNDSGIISIYRNPGNLELPFESKYITIYTCEDAQAWGTVTGFNTLKPAREMLKRVWEWISMEVD